MSEPESVSTRARSTEGGRAGGRPRADGAISAASTAMLDAAERLFAEHGIHQVSTREILRASGQSNQSALTYHFGNRLQLIAAMLDRRNGVINDLRHQRLDTLVAQGQAHDLRALIEAVVTSVTDVIRSEVWGRDFVMTSVQVLLDPQLLEIEALLDASRRSACARGGPAAQRRADAARIGIRSPDAHARPRAGHEPGEMAARQRVGERCQRQAIRNDGSRQHRLHGRRLFGAGRQAQVEGPNLKARQQGREAAGNDLA